MKKLLFITMIASSLSAMEHDYAKCSQGHSFKSGSPIVEAGIFIDSKRFYDDVLTMRENLNKSESDAYTSLFERGPNEKKITDFIATFIKSDPGDDFYHGNLQTILKFSLHRSPILYKSLIIMLVKYDSEKENSRINEDLYRSYLELVSSF